MKYWVHVHNTEVEQLLDIARMAEELGFEGIVDGDHWATPLEIKSKYPYSVDGSVPSGLEWSFPDNCVAAVGWPGGPARSPLCSSRSRWW